MTTKKNTYSESQLELSTSKTTTKKPPKTAMSEANLSSHPSSCHETPSSNHAFSPQKNSASSPVKTGCCMGTTTCGNTALSDQKNISFPATPLKTDLKKGPKTRVVVRYDIGFNNSFSIRGKGANLNWEKGIPLKNIKNDEWVWETEAPFNMCEFKVLINDSHYEKGENHPISCGASIQYTPKF